MKLFFFGGTFDPPHKGHLAIIDYCINLCDKLIIFPSKVSPTKNKFPIASDSDRVKMLNHITEDYSNVVVDPYEINQGEKSFTINTIDYLKEKFSNYDISMVIGLDQLQNFENWMAHDKILEKVDIICFRRNGYSIKQKYLKAEIIKDFNFNISSSYIRQNFSKKNFNYSNYLNKQIYLYIKKHKLYI